MRNISIIVCVVLAATWIGWGIWRSDRFLNLLRIASHRMPFIERQVKYQLAFFLVSLGVATIAVGLSEVGSSQLFGLGEPSALVGAFAGGFQPPVASWAQLGPLLIVVIGSGTLVLAYSSLRSSKMAALWEYRYWVLGIAAVNALSEEIIYRGAVLAVALEYMLPWHVAMLSAVLFGVAHVRGQASGVVVVIGSAMVGWFLAYSVIQTGGLFWAWCVHFVQDLILMFAFLAGQANSSFDTDAQARRTT